MPHGDCVDHLCYGLHALYVLALIAFTGALHRVEFRFHELKELWR